MSRPPACALFLPYFCPSCLCLGRILLAIRTFPCGRLPGSNSPLLSSTIFLAMASPGPIPPEIRLRDGSRRKYASKTRSSISSGKPGPLSATQMTMFSSSPDRPRHRPRICRHWIRFSQRLRQSGRRTRNSLYPFCRRTQREDRPLYDTDTTSPQGKHLRSITEVFAQWRGSCACRAG